MTFTSSARPAALPPGIPWLGLGESVGTVSGNLSAAHPLAGLEDLLAPSGFFAGVPPLWRCAGSSAKSRGSSARGAGGPTGAGNPPGGGGRSPIRDRWLTELVDIYLLFEKASQKGKVSDLPMDDISNWLNRVRRLIAALPACKEEIPISLKTPLKEWAESVSRMRPLDRRFVGREVWDNLMYHPRTRQKFLEDLGRFKKITLKLRPRPKPASQPRSKPRPGPRSPRGARPGPAAEPQQVGVPPPAPPPPETGRRRKIPLSVRVMRNKILLHRRLDALAAAGQISAADVASFKNQLATHLLKIDGLELQEVVLSRLLRFYEKNVLDPDSIVFLADKTGKTWLRFLYLQILRIQYRFDGPLLSRTTDGEIESEEERLAILEPLLQLAEEGLFEKEGAPAPEQIARFLIATETPNRATEAAELLATFRRDGWIDPQTLLIRGPDG